MVKIFNKILKFLTFYATVNEKSKTVFVNFTRNLIFPNMHIPVTPITEERYKYFGIILVF